ncbi:hypothetical protein K458DRAFT_465502 [Lentithecium fluviatile CBS 122367]|uniref:RBR-type E3 ubiquitin transferase n=1 Tax=Lentithecium fluviatile CBS 122367 TaxID=1168545 RepID=A0A6G1JFA2_9PLEO|nr:hypothetical protein K458DRAFT_465502 [Lentithecium fluviatile CBS 122367]
MATQAEELETLKVIFPEPVVSERSAHFELAIELTKPVDIFAVPDPNDSLSVSHLPLLTIHFTLLELYSSNEPPSVTLRSTRDWLPWYIAHELEAAASMMWEEYGHSSILFAFISHFQETAGTGFGFGWLAVSSSCLTYLVEYDRQTACDKFKKGSHECTICLMPKTGQECYSMEHCGHIFCMECLQEYYNAAIQSGEIDNVQCLSPNCGTETLTTHDHREKKVRHISPGELLQIPLERHVVQRYVVVKRKKSLDVDKSTIWCPRQWCQGAANGNKYPKPTETSQEQEIRLKSWNRLFICEDCNFAFCNCYLDSNRAQKQAEDEASLKYTTAHTSLRPKCQAHVSKISACNHIRCTQCHTHTFSTCAQRFWKQATPYRHCNTKRTPYYHSLWVLEQGEDENEGTFGDEVSRQEIVVYRLDQERKRRARMEARGRVV